MEKRIKKLQRVFITLVVVSFFGLLDILSRNAVYEQYKISDMGYVSLNLMLLFNNIHVVIGSVIGFLSSFIFGFTLLWIVLAIITRRQINKLVEKKEE